ncbi:MAG TPA: Hsp33 family molecular chaperone HslO [Lamprocystis sp. (in: g-proteobacteria)]|nr:Hsp33 family molecular chaperone HslO [Lamprocystis sp. (in: g-proteobacteria)]
MADTDSIRRFLFEHTGIRGNLVHLDASWRAVLDAHPYPEPVRTHLGQALAAVALLSATIKFDGSLILQVQGAGPIRTLVAQATSARTVRGLARWDGAVPMGGDLGACFGEGRLVLTIERGGGEPYQGIVPLVGSGIAQALGRYFEASEQIPTRLWLAADAGRAAGLLLQRLPGDGDADGDDWGRVGLLAATVKPAELLGLPAMELLHRLFHEETVRLFDSEPLAFRCGCSRARIEDMLRVMGESEVQAIVTEQGALEVTCEFCNRPYRLDAVDADQLFAASAPHQAPALRH